MGEVLTDNNGHRYKEREEREKEREREPLIWKKNAYTWGMASRGHDLKRAAVT
jgi:hypothetical protein